MELAGYLLPPSFSSWSTLTLTESAHVYLPHEGFSSKMETETCLLL